MMKRSAKFMGAVDSNQKKITSFFRKTNNNNESSTNTKDTGGQKAITSYFSSSEAGGRKNSSSGIKTKSGRKTSKLLKPSNGNAGVEVVDLADSDGEDLYCVLSGGGRQYTQSSGSSEAIANTRVPVSVQPFDPTSGQGDKKATDENVPWKCETESGASQSEEEDRLTCNPGESGLSESDAEGSSNLGLIRLVNYKAILEDSQSSQGSVCEMEMEASTVIATGSTTTSGYSSSSNTNSMDLKYSSSSSSAMRMLASPTRNRKGVKSAPSPASVSRTPTKSPKSKVNHFSPVRQLNFRSKSKTPVKSPNPRVLFKSPPSQSQVMGSPLKSLWSRQDPYYLKNFLTVVDSVLEDKHNCHLLNADDLDIVQKFRGLSKAAKCLYVRLAGRSWRWLRVTSVNYKEIHEDLTPPFQELHRAKLVSEIKEERLPLEELLDLLSHDKLPEICKQLSVKVPNNAKSKEKCIAALIKTIKQQSTLAGSIADIIYSKAMEEVGATYKLTAESRELFQRMFILYSPPQYWEQAGDKDALQLLSILLTELGKVEYPKYKITKTVQIYKDRKELLQFQEAWILFAQGTAYVESKQWDEVIDVAKEAMEKLRNLLEDPNVVSGNKGLPSHLRAYVAGTLFAKICVLGVEGFQKLKKYQAANEYLQFLLNQDVYLGNSYGRWYERLVLNSTHLKLPVTEVKGMIEKALAHPKVRDNHKLELSERLSKLKIRERAKQKPKRKPKRKKPKRRKKKKDDDDFQESSEESEESSDSDFQPESLTVESDEDVDVSLSFRLRHTAPQRTIEGEKMPMYDRVYGKSVFLDGDGSFAGGKSLSSVERFALQFYSQQGYTQGIHAEGAVPATIYGLLFWDVIYNDEIPDIFLSPYQAYPLDLFSEDFRSRRCSVIDERLGKMRRSWSLEDAVQIMQKHWIENCNKLSIVNWEIFSSFEQLKTLVSSMGVPLMAGICDRLADNYRYYRSGFPDLIAWNGQKCKIAEVKGPGDKLSAKQRLWIDYLLSLQADVEVCHVKSVSNKRIRS